MKIAAELQQFALNLVGENRVIAFQIKSKRTNDAVQRQRNYCYVCVARLIPLHRKHREGCFSRRALINPSQLWSTPEDFD